MREVSELENNVPEATEVKKRARGYYARTLDSAGRQGKNTSREWRGDTEKSC